MNYYSIFLNSFIGNMHDIFFNFNIQQQLNSN